MSKRISDVYLEPWQEIVGLFEYAESRGTNTVVILRVKDKICSLYFPCFRTSYEALQSLPVNSHVAILRTDDQEEPIHVRIIPSVDG